jgi:hypothetical protein
MNKPAISCSNRALKIQAFTTFPVTPSDPLFALLAVAATEAALCCFLVASVLAWDWHFGLPFAATQPWSAGAFHLATLFGRGPVIGTAVAWCGAAILLLCFASGDENPVHLLLGVFGAHVAVTSLSTFPQSAAWWFSNTLGFVSTSILSGAWMLWRRSPDRFFHR